MFKFSGDLDISKSWMNRALILQSYSPDEIQIECDSHSDDVQFLKKSLIQLAQGEKQFYVGLGGTTLRFLALRVSRVPGEYLIKAEPALWLRPQTEIINILSQLSVSAKLTEEGLIIHTQGWKYSKAPIKISTAESSQFLSAVILNSINLDFDLIVDLEGDFKSESYFEYTKEMVQSCGISIEHNVNRIVVRKQQHLKKINLQGELDVSSAFSLVSAAVLAGEATITNWNENSTQPDMEFLHFFDLMKIPYSLENKKLKVKKWDQFKSLQVNLKNCPDLFPVLSVLCAFAEGQSELSGATQLIHKESNRIEKTSELLKKAGFEVEELKDGLRIQGNPNQEYHIKMPLMFDPHNDHRMAMAASLLKLKNFPVFLKNPDCISKSYPQFYQHIGFVP